MSDYISREAAADVLRRLANALDEQIGYPSQMADVCQGVILDAATEISLLPAANVEPRRQRWIPVNERLPELPDSSWRKRTVLVCAKGHVRPMIYEREIVRGKTVERWKWMWNRIYDTPEAITHWMPLPEPPEKGGEGNAAL